MKPTPEAPSDPDRDMLIAARRGILTVLDGIERRLGMTRTAEILEEYRQRLKDARRRAE